MSVAKINTVRKSQKDQGSCAKCGAALPKGTGYRWYTVGFRSSFKQVRCLAPACTPKPSERESSSKAGPMSAVETFQDQEPTTLDDLASAFEDVAAAFADYADECESALDGWEHGNSMLEERAEAAREAADAVEGWEPEEFYGELDENDEPVEPSEYEEHVQAQKDEAVMAMEDASGSWI